MKRINILWIFLMIQGIISSCSQKDLTTDPISLKKGEILITLSPEKNATGGLTNKIVSQKSSPTASEHHLRYILEVYVQDNNGDLQNREDRKIQITPEFKLKLEKGKKYTLLAWVDFVKNGVSNANIDSTEDEYYTTNPLTNIQIIKERYQINNSGRDAFSGKVKDVTIEDKSINISLHRPFALLNLKEENSEIKSLKITYPALYTGFNVSTNDVEGETSEISSISNVFSKNDEHIIAFDYLFVHPLKENADPQKGSSLYNVTVEASKETPFVKADRKWAIQYAPFSRNYRTNLIANFQITTENGLSISIDNNFEIPEISGNKTFIVSSYVRPDFYQNFTRIDDEKMLANNDLILFIANPYWNGDIWFPYPDNSITAKNKVSHLNNYNGRDGVISFGGDGAYALAGTDLLNTNGKQVNQFSFGTWIYLEEWTPEAKIFEKGDKVSFKLGSESNKFIFQIEGEETTADATNFSLNSWHHVAITYLNGTTKFFMDGQEVNTTKSSNFPTKIPFFRAPMKLGVNLNAKLDETFFNQVHWININNYKNNGIQLRNTDWGSTKTLAYWKYDDAQDFGKDEQSWKVIAKEIRSKIQTSGKEIKLRLGFNHHDVNWQSMMADEGRRNNFAQKVFELVRDFDFDGADFDFEWCYNDPGSECNNNYSQTIVATGQKLKTLPNKVFSVSLHPVSYKISQEAIDATDFISSQVYGPSPYIYSYDVFKEKTEEMLAYGIPKDKLVLGVPFIGANHTSGQPTIAYVSFVNEGLITSPDIDEVVYKGSTYTLNGQTTMRKKVRYIREQGLLGIMSWDIATDTEFNNDKSLLRAIKEELSK